MMLTKKARRGLGCQWIPSLLLFFVTILVLMDAVEAGGEDPSASSSSSAGGNPQTLTLGPEDLMRLRASTDERVSTVVEWDGEVLAYKPGQTPSVIFKVKGMNVARAVKLPDGGGYDLLGRELQLYLDPKTDQVLRVWQNPYTQKNVTVIHVANNPVQQTFPKGSQYTARALPGGYYTLTTTIPLSYPNPINPTADPNSPFFPYTGHTQAKYSAIESFTFTFPISEYRQKNSKSKSIPSMQVHWTRTSPLLPFMASPDTNVTLLFVATGAKVPGGWRGLQSQVLRETIAERVPVYKEAPVVRNGTGGGVSSWSYFVRKEVFEAYLEGGEFPLFDPPKRG